jgi:hypothetical protein
MELEAIERCEHGLDGPHIPITAGGESLVFKCPGGRRIPVTLDINAAQQALDLMIDPIRPGPEWDASLIVASLTTATCVTLIAAWLSVKTATPTAHWLPKKATDGSFSPGDL